MATLTYWYCECKGDSDVYSIIAKTKKEAISKRDATGSLADAYGIPQKRSIYYKDAFDLFDWVTSEGGGRGCGDTN